MASPAINLLNEKWPQGSELQPRRSSSPTPTEPATQAAIESLKTQGLALDGLSEPVTVTPSRDGKAAMVAFTMAGGLNDEVEPEPRSARPERPAPGGLRRLPDVRTYVTGDAAFSVDVTQLYADGDADGSSSSCSACRSC